MTHLKSLAAPKHYPTIRTVFTVAPSPGPHPAEESIPLLIIVRDFLKYAEDSASARKIIKMRKILVDGRVVTDHKFPVGLMDVVSIPETDEHYRILPLKGKGLRPFKISGEEASFKVGQIRRKMHVRGGDLQFTLHDGRNIRFKEVTEEVRSYKTYDSFKISIPDQRILDYVRLDKGVYALIYRGSKMGMHGRVVDIRREVIYPDKPTVTIETSNMARVTTRITHVIPVGGEEPWVQLP